MQPCADHDRATGEGVGPQVRAPSLCLLRAAGDPMRCPL